jgi:hypothetical protein
LQKNTRIALGKGSSSAILSPTRDVKTRGKDIASDRLSSVITDDEMELVLGLFEKFNEKYPFLHLDICRNTSRSLPCPYPQLFSLKFGNPYPTYAFVIRGANPKV